MGEVRAYLISAAGNNEAAIVDINAKVDYLITASKKMGRKDWLMMAYGYIFTLCTNWTLSAGHLEGVMHLVVTGMHLIVGGVH